VTVEERSETVREARRRGQGEDPPNRRDVTSIAPRAPAGVDEGTPTEPDPATSSRDLRKDPTQKGGATGGG
jgi:hypothetical protein